MFKILLTSAGHFGTLEVRDVDSSYLRILQGPENIILTPSQASDLAECLIAYNISLTKKKDEL